MKQLAIIILFFIIGCSSNPPQIIIEREPIPPEPKAEVKVKVDTTDEEFIPKPIPKTIIKSEKKNKYLNGVIPYDKLENDSQLSLKIKGVDIDNFPDSVSIYFVIQDEFGNFVAGLAPPYTENKSYKEFFLPIVESIIDNGKRFKINGFNVTEYHENDTKPISISLALDYSGSMSQNINNLNLAVRNFIDLWSKYSKDEISIVKYDHRVYTVVPPNKNKKEVSERFKDDFFLYGGWTALYDGAVEAMNNLVTSQKPKVLILFTDGIENASFPTTANDVLQMARKNKIKIYTVGFGMDPMSIDEWLLNDLSTKTGGKYYFAPRGDEKDIIKKIFSDIFYSTKVFYKLTFKPIKEYPSSPRNVKLNVTHPKDKNITLVDSVKYYPPKSNIDLPEPERKLVVAYFDFNKDNLRADKTYNLEKFANYLLQNEHYKIEITGHTDSKGSDKYNYNLGLRRAKEVAKFLEKKGIKRNRMIVRSKGEKELLNNPDYDDFLARENRRVEVKFLK